MHEDVNICVDGDVGLFWQLPFSSVELERILRIMCLEFHKQGSIKIRENLPCCGVTVEFALVDESEISRLNLDFLGCHGPTNILAFPSEAISFKASGVLGWLAMSPHTMRREAMLFRQELSSYTLRLLAHGLAHLYGYDHGDVMDADCAKAINAVMQHKAQPFLTVKN